MKFTLNSKLDARRLAARYAERGRMRVENIFAEETAQEIHRRLSALDWWLTYNDGNSVNELHPIRLRQMSPQEGAAIQQKIFDNARRQYQFIYS